MAVRPWRFGTAPGSGSSRTNGGSDEVRVFDSSGGHVATSGGQGEGPGEFLELVHVAPWPGDSLVAWYAPGLSMTLSCLSSR